MRKTADQAIYQIYQKNKKNDELELIVLETSEARRQTKMLEIAAQKIKKMIILRKDRNFVTTKKRVLFYGLKFSIKSQIKQ